VQELLQMHAITDCMKQMRYQSCKADSELWTKAVVRADDGTKYYAYLLYLYC